MALAWPRREQEQHAGAVVAAQRMPFARFEAHHRPAPALLDVAAGRQLDLAVEHRHPRVLLDLVLAERLPRPQDDENCARTGV